MYTQLKTRPCVWFLCFPPTHATGTHNTQLRMSLWDSFIFLPSTLACWEVELLSFHYKLCSFVVVWKPQFHIASELKIITTKLLPELRPGPPKLKRWTFEGARKKRPAHTTKPKTNYIPRRKNGSQITYIERTERNKKYNNQEVVNVYNHFPNNISKAKQ